RRLHKVAAGVKLAALPAEVKDKDGADVRDILGQKGGEQLVRQAIEQAQEWTPPKGDDPATDGGTIKKLADQICAVENFAQDAGGKLYRFAHGVYKPGGEELVRRRVKALLNEWEATEEWSRALGENV